MANSTRKIEAAVVQVKIERSESGLLFATSEDIPGLAVSHRDLDTIMADLPQQIALLYRLHTGEDVRVIEYGMPPKPAQSVAEMFAAWLAVPPFIANDAITA